MLEFTDEGGYAVLLCPKCNHNNTHVDDVYVAGRPREDGPIVPIHVDSSGSARQGDDVDLPALEGRRHSISLAGHCESCLTYFAVEFRQHKGETHVRIHERSWQAMP